MKKFYSILLSLNVGDRIVVPKSTLNFVQHHAIYLGFWNNQFWIIENKDGYGVRLVSADVFFVGVDVITRIERFYPKTGYSRNDLKNFALSKRGKAYNLINYNCETFCNEVQHLVPKSYQSDAGVALGLLAGLALLVGIAASSSSD